MSLRVLIADADPVLLSAYKVFLIDEIETRTVTNGLDCLSQLRSWQPDVLVIDAELPRGSGLDVLVCMAEDPAIRDVPVLLLTTRPTAIAENAIALYDCALMIKPVPPAVLADVILTLADAGWGEHRSARDDDQSAVILTVQQCLGAEPEPPTSGDRVSRSRVRQ